MSATEAINECYSIRVFLSKPVDKEKLNAILAAPACFYE
jgi:nitroreductase